MILKGIKEEISRQWEEMLRNRDKEIEGTYTFPPIKKPKKPRKPPKKKKWQEVLENRPKNYNKIKAIIELLDKQGKEINRGNILEELIDLPTIEDNEAIEYLLK